MMKIIKGKLLKNIIILTIITICTLNISFYNDIAGSFSNIQVDDEFKTKQLKKAGSWILSPFVIDDTGGGDYTWAEAALEDWCSGSGTFSDPYIIENVTVNGGGITTGIDILNSDAIFIIKNCICYNSGVGTGPFFHAGIRFYNVSNAKLINNNCSNNGWSGIRIYYDCDNNTVIGNIASNNPDLGIYLRDGCNDNKVINNICNDNGQWGIELYIDCDNNNITRNIVKSNDKVGIQINSGCDNNLIFNNSLIDNVQLNAKDDGTNNQWYYGSLGNYWSNYGGFDANDDGIGDTPYLIGGSTGSTDNYPIWDDGYNGIPLYIDGQASGVGAKNWTWASSRIWCAGSGTFSDPYLIKNLEIDGGGTNTCIDILNSNVYLIIQNMTCYNSGGGSAPFYNAGIRFYNVSNVKLINNNCTNNQWGGIRLYYECDNNSIIDNNIDNSYNGIYLRDGCNNNSVCNNVCVDNSQEGIELYDNCDNNNLTSNTVRSNDQTGIRINLGCDSNFLYNNTITENPQEGIRLISTCLGNIIYKNNISSNLGIGVQIDSNNNNTLIYFNDFVGNTIQAHDSGTNNQWDNGIKGNYWSDYGGVDADDDGIGDIPYDNITGTALSQDNHPIWEDGDDLPPSINILSPTSCETFGISAPAFIVEIEDPNLDSMWYTIDGGLNNIIFTINETINQDNWINLPDGPVTLIFYANDTLGHLNFSQVVINKLIPITINIISPTTDQLSNSNAPSFIIELSGGNSDTMWYTINNGLNNFTFTSNGTINQVAWISMPDGTITIKFYANNTRGNVYSAEITVRKDTEAPIVSINEPSINDVFDFAPAYEITITESNLDTIWYTLDGGENNFTASGLTGIINQEHWTSLPNGYVTLRFYANDTLGHLNFDEVIIIKDTPTHSQKPGIPGYDLFLVLGIIGLATIIIIEFKYHKKII